MFNWKEIKKIVKEIASERGLKIEDIYDSLVFALASAYRKEFGKKGEKIVAKIDPENDHLSFWLEKIVVDDDYLKEHQITFSPERHIYLKEALEKKKDAQVGQEILFPLESREDFGRIAAQTAKQVILQKLKEKEKDFLFNEFKSKEGEVISGIVQRVDERFVFLDVGKTVAVLLKNEQIPGEFYRPGQRLRVYLLSVQMDKKNLNILVSRSFPKFVTKLFEMEVPEIAQGLVKIVSLVREPGIKTKMAVESLDEKIDPVGAVVGQRGTRIGAVISELGHERIDVIKYSPDPKEYIANALSPAKVLEVRLLEKNTALALVEKDQLSLAIGKDGYNVKLASKLTGWKIDVKSREEVESEKNELEKNESKKSE
ncbi:MAG: transcription termination factor NusA [Minisyncoccales bacterium]